MTYQYENCDPEGFQKLCQALLLPEFPGLHCFPVGQPDGGRDAVAPEDIKTIIQVKFKRRDEETNAKWLIDALIQEKPKIERLVRRGAKKYVMVTNASGSSHLDGGEIDLVEMWLGSNLEIPAEIYWRADLDIRMSRAPVTLWFNYPHVLTGTQGIALAIQNSIHNEKERRLSILRAFVTDQFRRDRFVKFKQVDLSNEIAQLFVDVPVNFSGINRALREQSPDLDLQSEFYEMVERRNLKSHTAAAAAGMRFGFEFELGAAEMILSELAQKHMKRVLLQGGPGQGKSTLAQYVCQIHRAHFIEEEAFLTLVPERLRRNPFRLPFKIDLRDLAVYLEGPATSEVDAVVSFEIFLAAQIQNKSGGRSFDVDDLYACARDLPVLLFLDGLDEVADPSLRQRLIEHIQDGLERLEAEGVDIQVVMTSRPTVFGRLPVLSKGKFHKLKLAQIGPAEVAEYADKWILARKLDDDDEATTRRILKEKIQLDHIRDLTRNPMQLAILLSLIHSVGYSLPDERTDLYQKYVDIFLTREADKDLTVREHRKLLVETVEYVAWVLQSRAETNRVSGSIEKSDLRNLVADYLSAKQESNEILDVFFTRGLERVYVLVERNEGFYEFEVQPLREFFCARFLYDRAPVGTLRERPLDDRSERLLAMAGNPYWVNVIRFYAGCYSTGELGNLMLALKQLIEGKDPLVALQTRRLAAALLTDWVFRSSKFIQNELIRLVFDKVGVYLAAAGMLSLESEPYTLHKDCGSETLSNLIAECYTQDPDSAYLRLLDDLLKANGGAKHNDLFSHFLEGSTGSTRTFRFARMLYTGAADSMSIEDLWNLMNWDSPSPTELLTRCKVVVQAFPDSAEEHALLRKTFIDGSLAGDLGENGHLPLTPMGLLGRVCSGRIEFMEPPGIGRPFVGGDRLSEKMPGSGDMERLQAFAKECQEYMTRHHDGHDGLGWIPAFIDMVESLRKHFGNSWAAYSLAVIAAGTPAGSWKGSLSHGLFDDHQPLVERARFVRLRRNPSSWMLSQLTDGLSPLERRFWIALVFSWLPAKDIEALGSDLESELSVLTETDFERVATLLRQVARYRVYYSIRKRKLTHTPQGSSSRLLVLWGISFSGTGWEPRFSRDQRQDPHVQDFLSERSLKQQRLSASSESLSDSALIKLISDVPLFRPHDGQVLGLTNRAFPPRVASQVLKNVPNVHPYLVEHAIASMSALQKIIPIASIATEKHWGIV